MIEKTDAGIQDGLSGAIEIQIERNFRFLCVALYAAGSGHKYALLPARIKLSMSIISVCTAFCNISEKIWGGMAPIVNVFRPVCKFAGESARGQENVVY
jgi:hypothetical protein